MLRLLAGVSRPTRGSVLTRGRVAPLLSVGVGFHPEMTGRENIYVNGMLLGFGRERIRAVFDDIVEFAELGGFIDTPVKFYSSGMYMRLGFSVAIHVEPDVLLVDEVLAVGDVAFRQRGLDRMRAMQEAGTALLFVSHSLESVQMLCPRAICVHAGNIDFDGPTEDAIARYHTLLGSEGGGGEPAVRIVGRALVDATGADARTVHQDDHLTYRATVRFEHPVESPQVIFRVVAPDSTVLYATRTAVGERWRSFAAGEEADVEIAFRPRFGGGGTFRVVVLVTDNDSSTTLLHDAEGLSFFVTPRPWVFGVADLDATITVDGESRVSGRSLRFGAPPAAIEGTA
jgi:ABC-2 type transport system ATP-binding protein